jgi:hypothetical protein
MCVLCGRGSTHSPDRTKCQCVGAFRTWQETTKSCVCQSGYFSPVTTEAIQTSTIDLDCQPVLAPICLFNEFVDDDNLCAAKSSCATYYKCSQGGYYDSGFDACFCNGESSNPDDFCDATCEANALKAYYTKDN